MPTPSPIEYFFSTHSAFAYLGSARFREIALAANRPVRYVPFDLRRALAASGHNVTGSLTVARHAYFFGREIERWAEYREVPIMSGRPTHHDNDLTLSSAVVIAAQGQDIDVGPLTHEMLRAHWQDDADLADPETLQTISATVGLAGEQLLSQAMDSDILRIYHANTDEAIKRNIFGSPTYFVDDDMFYGQDRLELVQRALTKPFNHGTHR